MSSILDETDVPRVDPADLARAMRFMIDSGRGLVLLRGVSATDMQELESAVWPHLQGSIAKRRAVLVRFQYLVEVFAARRLRDLMMRRGFRLIAPAIQLAAQTRLNTKWGFSAYKFTLGLQALIGELEQVAPSADNDAAVPLDLAA